MSLEDHPSVRWFFLKWPKWVKIGTAVVGIAGGLGTVMGLGGSIVNAIHERDTKMVADAELKRLDKERDDAVDKLLKEHTKTIEETKAGVQEIQTHLSKQDVQILDEKSQLDRIESAVLVSGHSPLSLASPTPP